MEKESFRILFDTHFEAVRRYLLYRSGNEEVATDIAQDTFMKVWEKGLAVDPTTARALLCKIAGDLFVSQYRRQQLSFNFFKTFRPNQRTLTPEDEVSFRELLSAYEAALEKMPETQRTVFLMNRIDDLKYAEIAERLNLSVKAIEKRMSQALEHLRVHLKEKVNGLILFLASLRVATAKIEKL